MTGPNYLDHVPDSVVELFHEFHLAIVEDAARRIAAMGGITDATVYQTYRAQAMGAYYEVILDELAKATGISREVLADLFNDAGVKTLTSDDALHRAAGKDPASLADTPELQNILLAGLEQTMGTFTNLTQSAAYYGAEQLGRALDRAWLKVGSGAFTYDAEVKSVIKQLSKSGIAGIQYLRKDGRSVTNNIDVVVRRATLTGVSQAALKLQMARMAEMETEYIETTAHAGARPDHALWQGKIFQLEGNTLYPNFYTETGYGTKTGLGGINCRHGFYPYYPGISRPANSEEYLERLNNATVTYDGREISMYEATQLQRSHEREIRELKRQVFSLEAAGIDASFERGELRAWQAAMRRLIEQTGLRREYARERAGRQYAS